jgi:hypothetical protein
LNHTEEAPDTLYCADDPTGFNVGSSLSSEEGHFICSNCAEKEREIARYQIEKAKKSMSDKGKCEVGGHIVNCMTGWTYCKVCFKKFCPEHGQIIFYRTNFHVKIWHRCINHLKFPNILGKDYLKKLPLFCGKPDVEEDSEDFSEGRYFEPFVPFDNILRELK